MMSPRLAHETLVENVLTTSSSGMYWPYTRKFNNRVCALLNDVESVVYLRAGFYIIFNDCIANKVIFY